MQAWLGLASSLMMVTRSDVAGDHPFSARGRSGAMAVRPKDR